MERDLGPMGGGGTKPCGHKIGDGKCQEISLTDKESKIFILYHDQNSIFHFSDRSRCLNTAPSLHLNQQKSQGSAQNSADC